MRALTLLPLCANIGSLLGPLIGGFLVSTKPKYSLVPRHPYAAPNICVAAVQALIAIAAIWSLEETLSYESIRQRRHNKPPSVRRDSITSSTEPTMAQEVDETSSLLPNSPNLERPETPPRLSSNPSRLPFRKIWTPNVLSTLLAQFIISGHLGTFAILWAMFLSLPVAIPQAQHLPFRFSGGVGLQPYSVGIAMSAFGLAGIVLQIVVYPTLQERWGTIRVWRGALCVFPIVYLVAPFCALIASSGKGEGIEGSAADVMPLLEWIALLFVLILFAAGRTGVVPATSLLINDCTPHPSVRGTIHTAGVIVSNLSRSLFPPMALAALGYGLKIGVVGLGFWFVAALAVLSCLASLRVQEGNNGEEL